MIAKIALPFVAVLLTLYITVAILTSGTNALSEAMLYLALFGLLMGLLNARVGMMFVFLCGNYLDFFKRFLVVSGAVTYGDIIKTLAVAPVAMLGVYSGIMINNSRSQGEPVSMLRLFFAFTVAVAVVATSIASRQGMNFVLQSAANNALYVGLFAFAGPLYPTLEAQHRVMKTLTLFFIPVVLYALTQLKYGYNHVEVRYALSGLTTVLSPLMHPSQVDYKRVFATMSSASAYTLVGIALSSYMVIFGFGPRFFQRAAGFLFAAVCLGTHIPGAGRTGWAIAVLTLGGYFVFRFKVTTILTYLLSIITILVFLTNSRKIGERLYEMTKYTGSTEFQARAMTMGTFSDRTEGIARVFTESRYFSFFGLPDSVAKESRTHDMLGQIYVKAGAVGLTVSVLAGGVMLYILHARLLRTRDKEKRKMCALFISFAYANIVGGVISGSQLTVFPVNIYFWMFLGLLYQLTVEVAADKNPVRRTLPGEGEEAPGDQRLPGGAVLAR